MKKEQLRETESINFKAECLQKLTVKVNSMIMVNAYTPLWKNKKESKLIKEFS